MVEKLYLVIEKLHLPVREFYLPVREYNLLFGKFHLSCEELNLRFRKSHLPAAGLYLGTVKSCLKVGNILLMIVQTHPELMISVLRSNQKKFQAIYKLLKRSGKYLSAYAFFTNSDFKGMAPNPSILQSMLWSPSRNNHFGSVKIR